MRSENKLICKKCGRKFKNIRALTIHILSNHKIETKKYYDDYFIKEKEGKCLTCNKKTKFGNIKTGYSKFCSNKCTQNNLETQNKAKQTCFKNYGVEHPMQSKIIQEVYKSTSLEKHGVEHPSQTSKFQEAYKNGMIRNYGVVHPMQSKLIQEKYRKTMIQNHGVKYPFQSEFIKEKSKQTCKEKYGCESSNQIEEFKEKKRKTCFSHFRVNYPSQSKVVKEKSKQTCRKKYNVDYPTQCEKIKEKSKQTCREKYGVEHPFQSKIIQEKSKQTCREKYGVENIGCLKEVKEKIKQTCKEKYGVEYWLQSSQAIQTSRETANRYRDIQKNNGDPLIPRKGKNETLCFDIVEQTFSDIKFLRNQRRFGYHPDDLVETESLKIDFEYDEPAHETSKSKKYDKKRDEQFMNHNFTVIRIKENNWKEDSETQIQKVKETIEFLEAIYCIQKNT